MSSYFRGTAVVLAFAFAGWHANAAPVTLDRSLPAKLRKAAAAKQPVVISGIDLGEESLSRIELEPMQVWASDAKIVLHHANGETERLTPPRILAFKGKIADDADSAVFMQVEEDGRVSGSIFRGTRQFQVATARRAGAGRTVDRTIDPEAPIFVRESDPLEEQMQGQTPWTCGADELPVRNNLVEEVKAAKLRIEENEGNVPGASYSLRLALETDTELYTLFGTVNATTAYLTSLVGQASVIYQRDLSTTLTIGHTNLYSGGSDPWAVTAEQGTGSMLDELKAYWVGTNTADYSQVQRSTVVMLSGKETNGGIAYVGALCLTDWAFAVCGSGTAETVVPDPTLTVNGVQYGMPVDNYWMLAQFAHELGHNVGSGHTHCMSLTAQEKVTYNVTRDWVDVCYSGQTNCYSGAESAPAEYGTIMSYCHNLFEATPPFYRKSRYLFGKAGETSAKALTILNTGLESSTPNAVVTVQTQPVACSSGRTASVDSCIGCTYAWSIAGGSINTATNTNSITYTPSAATSTLTVTIATAGGCGITVSKAVSTSCSGLSAPTNVAATATTASNVLVSWTAASGATSYNVYRTADNSLWSQVSTPGTVVGTTYNDAVSANNAYKYKVRAVSGSESTDSNTDFAVALAWTDPTLTVGTTAVKAAHVTELRTAVNALRTLNANQAAFLFTDNVLTATATTAKAVHVTELQTQLNVVRVALGASSVVFTETPVAGTTAIKATHLAELRLGAQ